MLVFARPGRPNAPNDKTPSTGLRIRQSGHIQNAKKAGLLGGRCHLAVRLRFLTAFAEHSVASLLTRAIPLSQNDARHALIAGTDTGGEARPSQSRS